MSLGAKASWNVIRVFQYPVKRQVIDTQDDVLRARALALTMAVLTQVHISRIRYAHAHQQVRVAQEYRSVQNRLMRQIRAEFAAGRVSEQTLLREEMNTLISEARYDVAFANLEAAHAGVMESIGELKDEQIDRRLPVEALANLFRSREAPGVPAPLPQPVPIAQHRPALQIPEQVLGLRPAIKAPTSTPAVSRVALQVKQ